MIELPETKRADEKSTAFLSMHKAGSSISGLILAAMHDYAGQPSVDIAGIAGKMNTLEAEFCVRNAELLNRRGYFFGPFRGPYVADMGGFVNNRVIIHIRDPRDCLTSQYFSTAYSHPPPRVEEAREKFFKKREAVQNEAIDDFCLRTAKAYARRCRILLEIMRAHPDYLVIRYEDMVLRTRYWLTEISRFTGVELTEELLAKLAPLLIFSVKKEDVTKKQRQVLPGDHQRKLEPATINRLNEILSDSLMAFGYAISEHVSSGVGS